MCNRNTTYTTAATTTTATNNNKIYSKMKSTAYDTFSFLLVHHCEQNWWRSVCLHKQRCRYVFDIASPFCPRHYQGEC